MRASRAVGVAGVGAAVLVAVLLGSAGPAGSGDRAASRVAAPRAPADATSPTLGGVDGAVERPPSGVVAPADDGGIGSPSFAHLPPGTRWVDGSRTGAWRSVYDGYGTTQVEAGEPAVLSQRPRAATSPDVTHGALAVTVEEYGDVDFTVQQRTVSQLRSPRPHAWEVPWVLWAHVDDQHFYYLVLKPNGWELGKEDPAYPGAQRFLATGSSSTFAVGEWHTVRIRHVGNTIEAWGDGELLTRFVDRERPYRGGHIGLYTEDAHVEHADLVVRRP